MLQIFHNNRCGKSRQCLALLEASGKKFDVVTYLTTPLNRNELETLLQKLNISPLDLVRQKEKIWTELYKGKSLTDKEILEAILQHPILMERPILATENEAIIAREEEKIKSFLTRI